MKNLDIQMNQLLQYQALPLSAKVRLSEMRIREWYDHFDGNVYVAYSGGKDSTILLHLVRSLYPDVPAVFANTGQELKSILRHVEGVDNLVELSPKMTFEQIIKKFGYPVVSKKVCRFVWDLKRPDGSNEKTKALRRAGITSTGKKAPTQKLAKKWFKLLTAPFEVTHKCCGILKINPTKPYAKATGRKPFVGTMADEGEARSKSYVMSGGCNAFNQTDQQSRPLMFWTEQDVLQYLVDTGLPYADCYGDIVIGEDGLLKTTGEKRTGCKFCLFGVHLEKRENRIQRLARTEPESYRYCIEELGYDKVMDYLGVDWKPVSRVGLEEQSCLDLSQRLAGRRNDGER